MELHTMGPGNYTQTDVTEAARALTGWIVNVPYRRQAKRLLSEYDPWEAVFVPFRHDDEAQTILGQSANHDPSDFIDLLLEQPATAEFVSRKLWVELVGTEPDVKTLETLASTFRADYSTMALVDSIVSQPEFLADDVVRSKVRSPVERLIAIAQGLGSGEIDERLGYSLHGMSYLPFNPPSPAGFPRGRVLLGPHQMVHSFDLLAAARPGTPISTNDLLARIGLFDVADNTREVLDSAQDATTRAALAVNTPEFALV